MELKIPTEIEPVAGQSQSALINFVGSHRFQRVLLLSGPNSFSSFADDSFLQRISETCEFRWFHNFESNPQSQDLAAVLEIAESLEPDLIVGVGGGTSLDLAKLTAGLIGKAWFPEGSSEISTPRNNKLLLVPTTAGSGAEATHFSVLYVDGKKASISGPELIPDYVMFDPALPNSAPKSVKAASGLDAICQCIESIWSKNADQYSQAYAIRGLNMLLENFLSFFEGDFRSARPMQIGANLSGKAINRSKTTAPHALSYLLTSALGLPHGIAVATTIGMFIDFHNELIDSDDRRVSGKLRESMKIINASLKISSSTSGEFWFDDLFQKLGLDSPRANIPLNQELRRDWFASADSTRLDNHPIQLSLDELEEIFR